MRAKWIMAAAALATATCGLWTAPAGAEDRAAAQESKLAKDDPSRRICRNILPVGTRITIRTCRTKAEWDASMDKEQDALLQTQMSRNSAHQKPP